MPRKSQGWITFQTSEEERQLLEAICQKSQRTKTEVLREMLRGLKDAQPDEAVTQISIAQPPSEVDRVDVPPARKSLKVSSRNVLEGTIKRISTLR